MDDSTIVVDRKLKIVLPKNMDKDTEIDAINLFFNELPQDSYLRPLLQGLPSYCEEQIRNDWTINPLDTIVNLRDDLSLRETRIKTPEELLEKEVAKDEYKDLYNFRKDLADKNGAALCNALTEVDVQKTILKLEKAHVTKLKARLYDLMTEDKGDF